MLAFVGVEAPVLASYSQQHHEFISDDIENIWETDPVGFSIFLERVEERLPSYEKYFREASKDLDVHWTFIAAISYQESHWDPKAISNTGVRGMMMLTQKTAKEMGIQKRTNAKESIIGGANYFQKNLDRLPIAIPKQDRMWMALASYNLGYVNINLARELTQKNHANPNLWSHVSIYLPEVLLDRYGKELEEPPKHLEALDYVERIKLYYKTLSILQRENEMHLLAKN